ncbi:hypothetical protein M514_28017 [Trichuris suis]|uniref:Uncharacterized protein n=1 Tax=Trichuris suis TaxID=68888 RepID=A0A085MRF3_9BILA|nr:hypothetical protein M514_28017 [Trichuris suis]
MGTGGGLPIRRKLILCQLKSDIYVTEAPPTHTSLSKNGLQWLPGGTDFFCHYARDCQTRGTCAKTDCSTTHTALLQRCLRNDKLDEPDELFQGCIYKLTCDCCAMFISETGQTLVEILQDYLKDITRYRNAAECMKEWQTGQERRRKQQKLEPQPITDELLRKSAMVAHVAECQGDITDT